MSDWSTASNDCLDHYKQPFMWGHNQSHVNGCQQNMVDRPSISLSPWIGIPPSHPKMITWSLPEATSTHPCWSVVTFGQQLQYLPYRLVWPNVPQAISKILFIDSALILTHPHLWQGPRLCSYRIFLRHHTPTHRHWLINSSLKPAPFGSIPKLISTIKVLGNSWDLCGCGVHPEMLSTAMQLAWPTTSVCLFPRHCLPHMVVSQNKVDPQIIHW